MQIHELNTFSGTPGNGNYLAIDDGTDTGKISGTNLLAPVNTRIDNIISGVTVDSEVIDARLGADGVTYGSLGTAIRTQVADVKSAISDVMTMNNDLFSHATWSTGDVNSTTGADASSSVRLRTDYIDVSNFDSFQATVQTGYKYIAYLINANKSSVVHFITWTTGPSLVNLEDYPTAHYVRFVLQKTDNTLPDSGNYLSANYSTVLNETLGQKMDTRNIAFEIPKSSLVSGSLQTVTMTVSPNTACVSYLTKIPCLGNETIKIKAPIVSGVDVWHYRYGWYAQDGTFINQNPNTTNDYIITAATARYISFMLIGYTSGDSQVSFNVFDAMTAGVEIIYADRYIQVVDLATEEWVENNFERVGTGGYVIGADYMKRKVGSSLLGSLLYSQSFCVYDDKYYSTDGSNIGVQDDDFTTISTTSLTLGHGNSFQLGHNGKAYVSGWNDQKIYAVDLSTLTIDSVINLPTSGYTSAVVDDVNGIAYILQRASYPDTIATYTFIAYDYVNEQTILTKSVNAFGALQACDYLDGKIVAVYGLGTAAVPNGMTVYNTIGDILATFDLDIFDITEVEGVAFDRENGGYYVSLYNKNVYHID